MRSSKSSSSPTFAVGDRVLYSLIRKGRRITIQVTIYEIFSKCSFDTETSAPMKWELEGYAVSSGRGGHVRVAPAELRPDTALDRIVEALDGMSVA